MSKMNLIFKATTGLPILVSASSCWQNRCPSFEEVWIEVAKIKLKVLRVFERGEQGGVATEAFCQLVKPDPQNPTYIIGLEPPALIQDTSFRSNTQLHRMLTPYLEQHMVFNLTPQHSFVDLHIDYGMDGISSPIDQCEKIWFLYPGTELNLTLMHREQGQHARFARLAGLLEGGVLVRTTSEDALYVPTDCLHAVFTIRGGFLVSIDCTTRDSIWPFTPYLKSNLVTALDVEGQRQCLFLYLECLAVALDHGRSENAICGWLSIESLFKKVAQRDNEWSQHARKLWSEFMAQDLPIRANCACSSVEQVQARNHFADAHLSWLDAGRQWKRIRDDGSIRRRLRERKQ